MTDKNQLEDTKHSSAAADDSSAPKATEQTQPSISSKARKSTLPKKTSNKVNVGNTNKISKTAVFALLLALTATAGIGGLYYWNNQQQNLLEQRLSQQNQKVLLNNQAQVKQLLAHQQQNLIQQLSSATTKIQLASEDKIKHLENTIARLSQNNPSDWLTHEAEYLIRIAARTMWLERDTKAAIGLLFDADARLKELNDPKFLPVRQLIHQDIAALKLMPELQTEDVILKLMALNTQVESLPLILMHTSQTEEDEQKFELSENISDWQPNLMKSWQRFLDTFVVIHSRSGKLEPLLSSQQRLNLKENLNLKLQQAQWSARQEKPAIYLQTLNNIQGWLNDYFDMDDIANQEFSASIKTLKGALISYNYPSTLASLTTMRTLLTEKPAFKAEKLKNLKNDLPESNPTEVEIKSQKPKDEPSAELKNLKQAPEKNTDGEAI
ncbi:MAG: uroporphyrinogen-III C-methyltransferase [Alteromonadaceae bacterium]|nr:uroporphyrinogen-III C-methyltransferase [Alteromonadaceae bacterium]